MRFAKQLAASALAALMLMTSASAVFSDTSGHWASAAIDKWSGNYGIIKGYENGTFQPDNPITRGAFAGILDRFLHFRDRSAGVFDDISGNYWEDAILKLHASGVYLGTDGHALAQNNITRQQAVTMISRAFQLNPENGELPYDDADQVAAYAAPAIAEMTRRGWITDSTGGRFRPTDPITRAELLNILNNMIQELISEEVSFSKDVDGSLLINSPSGAYLKNMTISGDLILAPGVSGGVYLENVTVRGRIRNMSLVDIETIVPIVTVKPEIPEEPEPEAPEEPEEPEEPEIPHIKPEEIYTPSRKSGFTFPYNGKLIEVPRGTTQNPFGEGDFEWDEDRLVYTGDEVETRFGIDVSAYQNRDTKAALGQDIDWDAVREDGVDFAMVRIGFRGTGSGTLNRDAFYASNIDGAMAAGIETGVYFFAQAITIEEALEEADYVLKLLEDHEIDGPVAYDWEMKDSTYRVYGTAPEMATACAIAFCQRIEEAGYTPMIYAGQYVSYIKYDQGAIADYLSWYPEYKTAKSEKLYPTFYYQMDYWQFTDGCTIDGISGRVDSNLRFLW